MGRESVVRCRRTLNKILGRVRRCWLDLGETGRAAGLDAPGFMSAPKSDMDARHITCSACHIVSKQGMTYPLW